MAIVSGMLAGSGEPVCVRRADTKVHVLVGLMTENLAMIMAIALPECAI